MSDEDKKNLGTSAGPDNTEGQDLEKFLEEKERMDALFKEKFTRKVTVMFTDLKGSTTIAEREGDMSSRLLIKHHNEIVLPLIASGGGVLVKTMGDGTMSYFESAQDSVRTAARILSEIDAFNVSKKIRTPILIRIGMHTGECIIEKSDIFGDVVNTASRFETSANPGEAYFSEDTYNAMTDKSELYCRFIKNVTLKGKSEPFKAYKVFWNQSEIDADKLGTSSLKTETVEKKPGLSPKVKVAIIVAIPIIIMLFLILSGKLFSIFKTSREVRSIDHAAEVNVTGKDKLPTNEKPAVKPDSAAEPVKAPPSKK